MEALRVLSLQNLKIFAEMSRDTIAFVSDLILDGQVVGRAENDGGGGCNDFDWENREVGEELERLARAEPPIPCEEGSFDACLDYFVTDLVCRFDEYEAMKELARQNPHETLYRLQGDPEGRYRTVKSPFGPSVMAYLKNAHGEKLELIANDATPPVKTFDPANLTKTHAGQAPAVDLIGSRELLVGTESTRHHARRLIHDIFEDEVVKIAGWQHEKGGVDLAGWRRIVKAVSRNGMYPSEISEPSFTAGQACEVVAMLLSSYGGPSVVRNRDGSDVDVSRLDGWMREEALRCFLAKAIDDCLTIVGFLHEYATSQGFAITHVLPDNSFEHCAPDWTDPVESWPNVHIHAYDGYHRVHEFRVVNDFSIFLFRNTEDEGEN